MKVKQTNLENTKGFVHVPNTDNGVDENGELAQGYQHVDALVWPGSSADEWYRSRIPDYDRWRQDFDNMLMNIANNLVDFYKPKYALDVGSGNGIVSKRMRDKDPSIVTVTVDANHEVLKSPYIDHNHFIARTDEPLNFVDEAGKTIKFDLIFSFEHLEHIAEDTLDSFMQNILHHSEIGTRFIFSACEQPYMDDAHKHVHCNAKGKDYWVDVIRRYGFEEFNADFVLGRAGNSAEMFCIRVK